MVGLTGRGVTAAGGAGAAAGFGDGQLASVFGESDVAGVIAVAAHAVADRVVPGARDDGGVDGGGAGPFAASGGSGVGPASVDGPDEEAEFAQDGDVPLQGAPADAEALVRCVAAVGDVPVGVQAGGEVAGDAQCGVAGFGVQALGDGPGGGAQKVAAPGAAGRGGADFLVGVVADQDVSVVCGYSVLSARKARWSGGGVDRRAGMLHHGQGTPSFRACVSPSSVGPVLPEPSDPPWQGRCCPVCGPGSSPGGLDTRRVVAEMRRAGRGAGHTKVLLPRGSPRGTAHCQIMCSSDSIVAGGHGGQWPMPAPPSTGTTAPVM